jgi:hypothetical protein
MDQPLLFVVGKGGVGRTTISAALAVHYARQGKRVLLVQWALCDEVSPRFGHPRCSQPTVEVVPNLFTMNFSATETIREYFVEFLRMSLLYRMVIQGPYVQSLIEAVPGLEELFFLGRLSWLLDRKAKHPSYDHIIIDTPATGHGATLFQISSSVRQWGTKGLMARETSAVGNMLGNPTTTAVLLLTNPEELPVQEVLDYLPQLCGDLGRPPIAICINRSVISTSPILPEQPDCFAEQQPWFQKVQHELPDRAGQLSADALRANLSQRECLERTLRTRLKAIYPELPIFSLPDLSLFPALFDEQQVIERLADRLSTRHDAQAGSNDSKRPLL